MAQLAAHLAFNQSNAGSSPVGVTLEVVIMMGHKEKLIDGDEYDALTRARKVYKYLDKAGKAKKVKRKFNKRIRKDAKRKLKETMDGELVYSRYASQPCENSD